MSQHSRDLAVRLFWQAVDRLHGAPLTEEALRGWEGEAALISLGKAARSMAEGALLSLGDRLKASFVCSHEEASSLKGLHWITKGSHPYPDHSSLAAGEALLAWLDALPPSLPIIASLSGGASSLIELPRPGASLADFQSLTRRSFAEGWDIERLNQERAKLSLLKGGGLARLLGPRLRRVLVMSDVPLGAERWVGSGPFWTPETAAIHQILASRMTAAQAMAAELAGAKFLVRPPQEMAGDLDAFRDTALHPVLASLQPGEAAVFFGELTLEAAGTGTGGRCQHLVLTSLPKLGRACLLAAGTDGRDGPTNWAGAAATALPESNDWLQAVADQNSSPWLATRSLCLPSRATGCNLNDIVIALVAK